MRAGVRFLLLASVIGQLIVACVPRPVAVPGTKGPVPVKKVSPGTRIVAAGILKGDMKSRSKVLSDLRIVKVANGRMTIGFDGYRIPDKSGRPHYEVKTVVGRLGRMVVPVVTVDSHAADGIVLRVTDPEEKMLLPLKYLVEHEFLIEVVEVASQRSAGNAD